MNNEIEPTLQQKLRVKNLVFQQEFKRDKEFNLLSLIPMKKLSKKFILAGSGLLLFIFVALPLSLT
ncbi:MAG: hypothetical protein KDC90_16485, partial [Ignavibacteriae bacterium]|nr:hypothetical protein [Ignavibacteriota bacterium]